MKHKICTECNEKQPIDCYYRDYTVINKISYKSKCKTCYQKIQIKRKPNDKDPTLINKECRDCHQILTIDNFYKNTRYKDGYFSRCKICHNTKDKTGYIVKRTVTYMKEYNKKRYKVPQYLIRSHIKSSVIANIKKKKNFEKSSKYLGCTIDYFKNWIEFQFDENMNWENHGSYWHFDHVEPCASFDLTDQEEITKCYNWKNYRPLEGIENIIKSNKIIPRIIKQHKKLVKKFMKKNSSSISSAST